MNKQNREALIAAAIIIVGFGVAAFFLPRLILAVGEISPIAAAALAILFVAGFFLIFWLRARSQRRERDD